ncbi:MAG: hypothetical protein RL701_364 [Pseudomonadota bacterium]
MGLGATQQNGNGHRQQQLDPQRSEAELAAEFLELQNEAELDHFLPFLLPALKLAAPLIGKVAGPLVKGLAGKLLGGGGSKRRRRPTAQEFEEEQFLGKILGGLFGGELEAESEHEEHFLGGLIGKLLGEAEFENEQEEQFIGGLLGKIFGGNREVQEQFLGGLLGKVFGEFEFEDEGETEGEAPELGPQHAEHFIRYARRASHLASQEITALLRSGQKPQLSQIRRIVLSAFVRTAQAHGQRPQHEYEQEQEGEYAQAQEQEQEQEGEFYNAGASDLRRNRGRWSRSGARIIIHL